MVAARQGAPHLSPEPSPALVRHAHTSARKACRTGSPTGSRRFRQEETQNEEVLDLSRQILDLLRSPTDGAPAQRGR
jgi:hypothetical protein